MRDQIARAILGVSWTRTTVNKIMNTKTPVGLWWFTKQQALEEADAVWELVQYETAQERGGFSQVENCTFPEAK